MTADRISLTSDRVSLEFLELPQLPTGFGARVVELFKRWREHARQRDALVQLDVRMLRDIGLTKSDVHREERLPLWFV